MVPVSVLPYDASSTSASQSRASRRRCPGSDTSPSSSTVPTLARTSSSRPRVLRMRVHWASTPGAANTCRGRYATNSASSRSQSHIPRLNG